MNKKTRFIPKQILRSGLHDWAWFLDAVLYSNREQRCTTYTNHFPTIKKIVYKDCKHTTNSVDRIKVLINKDRSSPIYTTYFKSR